MGALDVLDCLYTLALQHRAPPMHHPDHHVVLLIDRLMCQLLDWL